MLAPQQIYVDAVIKYDNPSGMFHHLRIGKLARITKTYDINMFYMRWLDHDALEILVYAQDFNEVLP